jgi:thiamine pyrophosphate-dependent acetolactate synthase large subunit-like protein
VDIDAEEIARYRHPACALIGDAATVLRALLPVLRQCNR